MKTTKPQFRDLYDLANATPQTYLAHIPANPQALALQLIEKASQLWPVKNSENALIDPTYQFLFVGPGSGLVIDTLINQGHRAYGMESSKRGIMAAPEEVRGYIAWCKPWEPPYASMQGEHPVPIKHFHIAIINKFLKTYYTQDEWNATIEEVKKLAKETYQI